MGINPEGEDNSSFPLQPIFNEAIAIHPAYPAACDPVYPVLSPFPDPFVSLRLCVEFTLA